MMAYNSSKAYWQSTYKDKISTIDIVTTNSVPGNAVESWDVSEKQDGGVMAYIIDDGSNSGMYKLYIGGECGVTAPTNSSYLFSYFRKTTAINGLENLDTSNVTNMQYMFYYDKALTELDVSNFDTSNVTNMGSMFQSCSKLTSLDVSNFDTSNVTDMSRMFSGSSSNADGQMKLTEIKGLENFNTSKVTNMYDMFFACGNLTSLDVSNFDTSKVTNMSGMFSGWNGSSGKMTSLNICNFDTSNVTNMSSMFSWNYNLTTIYVGSNWTIANADTTNMFANSGVSSVTTGQC